MGRGMLPLRVRNPRPSTDPLPAAAYWGSWISVCCTSGAELGCPDLLLPELGYSQNSRGPGAQPQGFSLPALGATLRCPTLTAFWKKCDVPCCRPTVRSKSLHDLGANK